MRNIFCFLLFIGSICVSAQSEKANTVFGLKVGLGPASIRQLGHKDSSIESYKGVSSMLQFFADIPVAKNTSIVLGAGGMRRTVRQVHKSQIGTSRITTSDGFLTFSALAKRKLSQTWQVSLGSELGANLGTAYIPVFIDSPVVYAKVVLNGIVEGSRKLNSKTALGVRLQHGILPESTYLITENNQNLRKTKRYPLNGFLFLQLDFH